MTGGDGSAKHRPAGVVPLGDVPEIGPVKVHPIWLGAALAALGGGAALAQGNQADKAPAPAPAEPAKVRRAETIVDDNWTVTCAVTDQAGAKRQCSALLRIVQTDKNGAQRVVVTWVLDREGGRLMSAISVPSGLQIPPGMEVRIGDKDTRKLLFSICQPDHCEALLPLDEPMVKSLSAAPTTEVSVRAVNGAVAKFTVNMKGFAQAVADLGK